LTESLKVELRPSLLLAALLALVHLLALVAVWVSLDRWPLWLASAGILVSAAACLARALQLEGGAVLALELHPEERVAWKDRGGAWHDAQLGRDHFVSGFLVVMALDQPTRRGKHVVLLPDSAPAADLRRLRVRLRLGTAGAKDNDPVSQ